MSFNKLLETIILIALFVATIGSAYIFIVTIFLKDRSYAGFYSTWQFPMLLAIITDATYYKHIISLT
jgi:hypothetical protein